MIDRLPVKPFQEWVENRIEFYEREVRFGGEGLLNSGAASRVAEELGWEGSGGIKKLYRHRYAKQDVKGGPMKSVSDYSRAAVEEALWNAGVFLWEVYPEVLLRGAPAPLKRPRILAQQELILEAKGLYESAYSFAEISEILYPGSGYASEASLAKALSLEFENQGWPRRGRSEAAQLLRRPSGNCMGIVRGRQCRRRTPLGRSHCAVHDPSPIEGGWADRRRQGLDPAPFSTWIRQRAEEVGGMNELASRVGRHFSLLYRWAGGNYRRSGSTVTYHWVEPDTVRRILKADGTTTFEELYGERQAA